jgi:hypothetical protein
MEANIVEEAMMPVTNKLTALAQLFDAAAFSPNDLNEAGFIGVSEMLRSIEKEMGTICGNLDKRIVELSKGSK